MESFAPAKVNLFLHVGPPGRDGYHPICSLMVFADIGDTVSFTANEAIRFEVKGPFAAGLGDAPGNLVERARDALLAAAGAGDARFTLGLDKQLPVASGLGGGSSDAAATMRLIRHALGLALDEAALSRIALELGSDVPACLSAATAIATGRGEHLAPPPTPLPSLDAVLVNPGAPSATGAVFRAYDAAPSALGADAPAWPTAIHTAAEAAAFLAGSRNDLQAPAIGLQPLIGAVLDQLAVQPETLFARMSGSGATCFALCAGEAEAARLADRLARDRPFWWARACRLGAGRA